MANDKGKIESSEPKQRGRKPQWTDTKVEIICKAIAEGKSYKYAYTSAKVSHTTFFKHLNEDAEFADRVKKAEAEYREYYDANVVVECKRSLLELICGYEWDETTTETMSSKDGKGEITKTKVVHKKAAPNVTAIIFALCNRAPEEWSNKHIQELSGKVEVEKTPSFSLSGLSDDLLGQVVDAIKGK